MQTKITKKELSQLYNLNREIEYKRKRIKELEEIATSCNAKITGMPFGSGISDKIGSYASEIADLRALLELDLQKCFYELNRLNRFIDSVEDSYIRRILSLRYISGYSWRQVAFQMGGGNSEDGVRMAHERFLKKQ